MLRDNSLSNKTARKSGLGTPPKGGAFYSYFNMLVSGMNVLGTAWVCALMVLINMDSMGRTIFASPIDGVIEMIELSLVGIVFLQLADATRKGRLTRSDGLFNQVMKRKPKVGRYLGAVIDLLGALFMAIIVYGSWPLLMDSIEHDYYVGNIGIFTAPVWPVKTIILIGAFVMMIQFLIFAGRFIFSDHTEHTHQSIGK